MAATLAFGLLRSGLLGDVQPDAYLVGEDVLVA